MSELFERRVTAERRILSIINENNAITYKLTGLTSISIREWGKQGYLYLNPEILSEITSSLYQLARMLHTIVNVSDEIFDEYEEATIETEINNLISNIKLLPQE